MSWQSKSPSIRLSIDKSLFNKLMSVLDFNISLNIEEENFSSTANTTLPTISLYRIKPQVVKIIFIILIFVTISFYSYFIFQNSIRKSS